LNMHLNQRIPLKQHIIMLGVEEGLHSLDARRPGYVEQEAPRQAREMAAHPFANLVVETDDLKGIRQTRRHYQQENAAEFQLIPFMREAAHALGVTTLQKP